MSQSVIEFLTERAKRNPKRVALPECEAEKTLLAAKIVLDSGIGYPVLVNDPEVIKATAEKAGVGLDGMEILDIKNEAAREALVEKYMSMEPRDMSAKGYLRKIENPVYYGMMLVAVGDADCIFCGHTNTTGDVLIAALKTIGLQDGVDVASIYALVEVPGFNGPEGDRIVFADCGLSPEPAAPALASIAIAAADNVRKQMGWEPRVAFLSFSSDGSGKGESVDKVREALRITNERRPDIKADGEFQLDVAIDPETAASKLKRPSEVAGKANILIFPDLNAANIGIKLMQFVAGGSGYGHTISGLRRPVADSSRVATVEEMVGDIAMVVLSASE